MRDQENDTRLFVLAKEQERRVEPSVVYDGQIDLLTSFVYKNLLLHRSVVSRLLSVLLLSRNYSFEFFKHAVVSRLEQSCHAHSCDEDSRIHFLVPSALTGYDQNF